MININHSKQHAILEKCTVLNQYSQMIDIVRKYTKQDTLGTPEKRVEVAIRECIKGGILEEYLLRKESEVVGMLSSEYNYENDIRVQREEAADESREKVLKLVKILLAKGKADDIEKLDDKAYLDKLLKQYHLQ